jgi:hypothetical protein
MNSLNDPRCRFGFRPNEVVTTPARRRAVLIRLRQDSFWDARYVQTIDGNLGDEVVLHPEFLKRA